jgi:hypothetical protein
MADDDKQPGTILAIAGVILVVLLAVAASLFNRESRLLSSRPAMVEASIPEPYAGQSQTIDARLWQDPFAAIARSLDKSSLRVLEKQCQKKTNGESGCSSPLVDKDTLVIGVTMLGAPYSDDAERRRRTRYAVLAGLERARFVPLDSRHIGYFLWTQADATPATAPKGKVALQHVIVGYERFEKGNASVLVLWLAEDALKGRPLQKVSDLIKFLNGHGQTINEQQNIKIVGPYSSDTLRDMVNEAGGSTACLSGTEERVKDWKLDSWPSLRHVQFYVYGASVPDNQLLACGSVQTYFEKLGLQIQRTIATDDTLAGGIASELMRREVDPGKDDIALISEWGTFYSQSLSTVIEQAHSRWCSRSPLDTQIYVSKGA